MGTSQVETMVHAGLQLAFQKSAGVEPTFVWLGGFKSDMAGTKAQALADWAQTRGQAFLRFDYSGHGCSGGRFDDGTISGWLGDALAVIDAQSQGPLVLVGSSMGGWLSLLAARERAERVRALLLIAPAADMTERLMWPGFDADAQRQIVETGRYEWPSLYDPEPYVVTRALIEDGRRHLIMDDPIAFPGPVRILQGGRDPDVPEAHVRTLAGLIQSPDLRFTLVPDGDHRLSRPEDIDLLKATADELAESLAR